MNCFKLVQLPQKNLPTAADMKKEVFLSVQLKLSKKHKTRWEEDYQLINSEGLFQEYLEMGKF